MTDSVPNRLHGLASTTTNFLANRLAKLRRFTRAELMLGIGLLGLGARVYLLCESLGSNDILTWERFSRWISEEGLGYVYDSQPIFNHPPLMGLWGALVHRISVATGLPFAILFKTPAVLADVCVAVLLERLWRRNSPRYAGAVFALFCWSPVSILISAYHGNTDSLCAAFVLLAALAADTQRPLLAGISLGASINVKLIPVILIPLLLSATRSRREAGRYLWGLGLGAVPFVPVLITHWQGFSAHVLGHRAYPGWWGISALLHALATVPRLSPRCWQLVEFWNSAGAALILILPCVVALVNWRRHRPWTARELAAWAIAMFLVLAPGWGIQYLVYLVPVLFAANVERAVVYSVVAGAYALVTYFAFWTGQWPLLSVFPRAHPPGVLAMSYLAWMVTIRTALDLWRRERRAESAAPSLLGIDSSESMP